jgi:hypothetical protein
MIWWFLILGISTLVVLLVAIGLYMRIRSHMRAAHSAVEGNADSAGPESGPV